MKNNIITWLIVLAILFIVLSAILFSEVSFWFLGIVISIIGSILLYKINH